MERITERQIARLVDFVEARISDTDSRESEAERRAASALRLVVHKQVAAIRYYRSAPPKAVSTAELHATASWNLLVGVAQIWRDHLGFPEDAAIETFEFEDDHPLLPTGVNDG
ncbi:hypothetical protein [Actinoplanes rectilineatus]|uniref:hypothetical protein n=1 Tax=Actinoplanes rectilineatus TaxID=113571 RepID=UPI0012F7B526|nr:hypothetical protein [Actinoplanes rectilineatus]